MKVKFAVLLVFSMILSLGSMSNIYAEEIKFQEQLLVEENSGLEKVPDISLIDKYSSDLMDNMIISSDNTTLDALDGDIYENNNGPKTATIGRYNEICNIILNFLDYSSKKFRKI